MKIIYLQDVLHTHNFDRADWSIELHELEDGEYACHLDSYDEMDSYVVMHRAGTALCHYWRQPEYPKWNIHYSEAEFFGTEFWRDPSKVVILSEEMLQELGVPLYS